RFIAGAINLAVVDHAQGNNEFIADLSAQRTWLLEGRRQQKLARSAGVSPAQVRPSKPPGSECCVRRRRRRTRSVHSGCVGCVIEPRNDEFAGAETVVMVERNMCNAVNASHCRPAGVQEHITRKRIASEAGISRDWPSVSSERDGPHREGEEPKPMMHGHEKSRSAIVAVKPT